jgi:hypothetical protein
MFITSIGLSSPGGVTVIQIIIYCQWKPYNHRNLGVTQSHKDGLEGRLENCVIF